MAKKLGVFLFHLVSPLLWCGIWQGRKRHPIPGSLPLDWRKYVYIYLLAARGLVSVSPHPVLRREWQHSLDIRVKAMGGSGRYLGRWTTTRDCRPWSPGGKTGQAKEHNRACRPWEAAGMRLRKIKIFKSSCGYKAIGITLHTGWLGAIFPLMELVSKAWKQWLFFGSCFFNAQFSIKDHKVYKEIGRWHCQNGDGGEPSFPLSLQ